VKIKHNNAAKDNHPWVALKNGIQYIKFDLKVMGINGKTTFR